jgi:hypothetical protein
MSDERKEQSMDETTRRGILGRGLLLIGGVAGLGAAGGRVAFGRRRDEDTLVLYARNVRSGRRLGALPLEGERLSVRGELLAQPEGESVGEFLAAAFALGGAAHPAEAERLELHTFKLPDGSLFGTGSAGQYEGAFAITGGTGRFAGAQGTYVARQSHEDLGGDGSAEFVFSLKR